MKEPATAVTAPHICELAVLYTREPRTSPGAGESARQAGRQEAKSTPHPCRSRDKSPLARERKPISRDKSALKYRKVFCDSLHYPPGPVLRHFVFRSCGGSAPVKANRREAITLYAN